MSSTINHGLTEIAAQSSVWRSSLFMVSQTPPAALRQWGATGFITGSQAVAGGLG